VDDIDRTEEKLGGPIHAAPSSLSAQLLDQLADAVLVADADGRYVEANLAAATLLGYTRTELLSMSIADVTAHPREWSEAEFERLSRDGYWRGMVDLRRKDGSLVHVEARASTLETPEGRWGVAVLRESDREARVGSSVAERRLAAIVQSSDDAIFSVAAGGLIESWNPAAERLYGFRAEEIVGKHVELTAPPERREEVAQNIRRTLAGEHVHHQETVRLAKDGRRIDVALTISPIHDRDGNVTGMSTIARDITDRKRAEERTRALSRALGEARDTLELVTIGAADGITIQDAQGRVVYANLAAARMSGYGSVDEFLAADPRERLAHWVMLNEEGEPFPLDELPGRRVLAGEPEAEAVLRVRGRRDGHEFWSLVKATATFDMEGRVRYAINLFRDITDQKEVERGAQRKAAQMSHLYAITAALAGATDVAVIAEALAEQTLTAFDASRGAVVLRSQDGTTLETVAWRGHEPGVIERWRRFPLDPNTPIGDAVLRNEPVIMPDRDAWIARYPGLEGEQIPAAAASIPLDIGDGAIGGLTLSFDQPREFTAEDVGFMLGAARQGAQALERARSEETRRRAEERLALLARAGGLLAESLDYPKTLTAVTNLVVPQLADWASVEILEPDGSVQSLAVSHVDPEKVAFAKEFRRRRPPDLSAPTGVGHVITSGRAELVPEITDEMIAAIDDPEVKGLVRELRLRSVMIVPLAARGRTLGAMTFVWAESGNTYTSADLAFAETLAARIALVIDNARLFRDRDHIARTLQQSLLPPEPPAIEGVDLAARYRPSGEGIDVGGDFYDAFDIGDGEWTVALGDVCGKGPDAAALMGMVRHTIRAAAIRERAPARVLATVNAAVARQTSEDQFCTAVAARLRPQEGQVIVWICVAGHPAPVVLRGDGSLHWIRGAGALLGVFDDAQLADDELRLTPGDTLILYTDGVTEERGAQGALGEDGLTAVLEGVAGAAASEIVDRIERAVLAHGSGEPRDDIAILAVRATG
jgi:PAS domain S-box-containing protein